MELGGRRMLFFWRLCLGKEHGLGGTRHAEVEHISQNSTKVRTAVEVEQVHGSLDTHQLGGKGVSVLRADSSRHGRIAAAAAKGLKRPRRQSST